jgi:hypothetical protein
VGDNPERDVVGTRKAGFRMNNPVAVVEKLANEHPTGENIPDYIIHKLSDLWISFSPSNLELIYYIYWIRRISISTWSYQYTAVDRCNPRNQTSAIFADLGNTLRMHSKDEHQADARRKIAVLINSKDHPNSIHAGRGGVPNISKWALSQA